MASLIPEHHPGFLDWPSYEANQERIAKNTRPGPHNAGGAVREGGALLQGLAHCGHCGRRLHTHYRGRHATPGYHCPGKVLVEGRGVYCLNIGGVQIDEAVTRAFIAALEPAGLAATLAAAERLESDREAVLNEWRLSARPVLAILAKEKLLSTFGAKFADKVNPVTGRLHTSYLLAGTKAGRFSASGPNLQQLPSTAAPEFKRCIVAAPGHLLVGCDWSQIEMRAAAWISGDRALTRVYADGRDLHAETAASVARVPVEHVTKEQRQAAKPVNFGAIYGIGPTSLAANAFADYGIEMSERDAAHALDRRFRAKPCKKLSMVKRRARAHGRCRALHLE
jgi:hypothetical protein